MTNAEKFRKIFKEFATEVWAFPEKDFLTWLNAEYEESTIRNCFGCKYSKDNHNAGTEECHLCMWENQYTPTTKNDLGVDAISRQDVLNEMDKRHLEGDYITKGFIKKLPSVTPQEPRKGYLSIDDVMAVFDDFMCGEVDEDGTETFLEMLKDKADMREVEE